MDLMPLIYNPSSPVHNEASIDQRKTELKEILIEKILVYIDDSSSLKDAVKFAVDLAKKYSAEIHLLHVISLKPICDLSDRSFLGGFDSFMLRKLEDEGKELLASASNKVDEAGIKSITWLDYGQPARRIINAAKEEDVDLIVICREKRGLIAKIFLGSLCDEVSKRAPCPVLIVNK